MDLQDARAVVNNRLNDFISCYTDPQANTAFLLCDRHDPARVAYTIVGSDASPRDITFGTLRAESDRLAEAFWKLGFRLGDRIATLMGKSRHYLVTVMAIWRLGAVHVPLFTAFAPPEISFRLEASGCKLIVCDAAQGSKLVSLGPSRALQCLVVVAGTTSPNALSPDGALSYDELMEGAAGGITLASIGGPSPVIQIYTSGTTGRPKGVLVPLHAFASFHAYMEFGLGLQDDDIFWNAADPGWAYGLYFGIIGSLLTGVRSILLEGSFSAEATFAVLARQAVTNFAAAPTVFRSLRASGIRPDRTALALRRASSAGEPLTQEVNEWASAVLGVSVHDHYGQTETGMLINNHHHVALRRPIKIGSMGRSMPGWSAVVLQPDADESAAQGQQGRVAIDLHESPLAWFGGYVNDPTKSNEKLSKDGRWYLTGDLGRIDDEGDFYFASREDDVILMAGYRIGPVEIESVLAKHPAVGECAVVSVQDDIRGEVLEAVVVLALGQTASDELTTELQQWVKTQYAAHAYPRRVHYADSLPKTPSGKVQRFVLRQRLQDPPARAGSPQ